MNGVPLKNGIKLTFKNVSSVSMPFLCSLVEIRAYNGQLKMLKQKGHENSDFYRSIKQCLFLNYAPQRTPGTNLEQEVMSSCEEIISSVE